MIANIAQFIEDFLFGCQISIMSDHCVNKPLGLAEES